MTEGNKPNKYWYKYLYGLYTFCYSSDWYCFRFFSFFYSQKMNKEQEERIIKNQRKALFVFLIFICGITQAQESVSASGGNATGNAGTTSFTIGQVFHLIESGTTGSIAHGVQQPYEISIVTGIEPDAGIDLICQAHPNPACEFVMLKIEDYNFENLTYILYDINGKLLAKKKITENETIIAMKNLTAATYFLKLSSGNKEVKTFKIIKR